MSAVLFSELEQLIREYETDSRTIKGDRIIMKNYPKVFVMSTASQFERQIKKHCQSFLDNPIHPIEQYYPLVGMLNGPKPKVDKMFAKLEAYNDNGVETLCAEGFYAFWGGQAFKTVVKESFNETRDKKIEKINGIISSLLPLIEQDDAYAFNYAKNCYVSDILQGCSFEDGEHAYLSIKLRRNRVAHDYLDGLTDTFEDLQTFYQKAVIYVAALMGSIDSQTTLVSHSNPR